MVQLSMTMQRTFISETEMLAYLYPTKRLGPLQQLLAETGV
jgi:hypothetical protein